MTFTRTLILGLAAAGLMMSGAQAADLLRPADPIYSSPLFNFEGFYVGATGGGAVTGGLFGTVGVVAGSNFALTDGVIGGIEFQGDLYFNGTFAAYDALALGRLGGYMSDNVLAYGEVGAGLLNGAPVYAFGGGLEMAMTDNISIRGELQGIGGFGALPSVGKATAGLIFHLN